MSSILRAALVAPLVTLALAGSAHADESDLSLGVGSIYISSATPILNITVQNQAASTNPDDRDLRVVSSAPAFSLTGQVFCKAILSGSTRLLQSQVMFGTPSVMDTGTGTAIWDLGVWDETDPIVYSGTATSADVSFDHAVSLPDSWDGGLYFGFNPVRVVENHLATYVDNGGSPADFLRQDDVFDVQIPVNLVGVCENTSTYGVYQYAGYTRRWITAEIFYEGDPDIKDPITVPNLPDQIAENPDMPPQFYLEAPITFDSETTDDTGGSGSGTTFASYPIYDIATATFDGQWSGWVTYEDGCRAGTQAAVTSTGECVVIDTCLPQEFATCDARAGCCDATDATTTTTR